MKPSPDSSPLQRLRRLAAHPEFRAGAREISGVAPGLAAWGLMTGVAMVQSGMSTVEAVAMTLLVFAGSSQLAAIPLIAAVLHFLTDDLTNESFRRFDVAP